MKRCVELRDLSEDHHHGLVLAQRSKRAADGGDVAAAWGVAEERFRAELAPHFAVEESALVPALVGAGASDLAERLLAEHAELRAHFAAGAARDAEALAGFGRLLEAHIRFEERELFQRAQALLSAEALGAVANARIRASVRRSACELEGGGRRRGSPRTD